MSASCARVVHGCARIQTLCGGRRGRGAVARALFGRCHSVRWNVRVSDEFWGSDMD